MKYCSSFTSILLLFISFLLAPANGQFGIPKNVPISQPQNGDELISENQAAGLGPNQGYLTHEDAAAMEAIILEAKRDVETMAMITKMKSENSQHLAELQKLPPSEILGGMKEALDNMKLIEYLFKDKQRAVREMEKEGMIEKAHVKKYRKDPDLLEQDTRRGLYFQFISLAVVGGYIE
jgi:hypothetical protein